MGIGKLASKAFAFIERKAVTTPTQTGWLKAGEKLDVNGLRFAPQKQVYLKKLKEKHLTKQYPNLANGFKLLQVKMLK